MSLFRSQPKCYWTWDTTYIHVQLLFPRRMDTTLTPSTSSFSIESNAGSSPPVLVTWVDEYTLDLYTPWDYEIFAVFLTYQTFDANFKFKNGKNVDLMTSRMCFNRP